MAACIGVEVDEGEARGQSLARRAAKATVRQVFNTRIGNKKKPWTDSVRGACKARAFEPSCNTVVGRPGWLSSHARPLVFPRARK